MSHAAAQSWVLGALHLHVVYHHVRLGAPGSKLDYVGVLVGAIVSWAGLPGPGEAALIAAAIAAAHHHLDLSSLILIAWAGATAGGMLGWLAGMWAGRGVVTAPGPLRRQRVAIVARGDRFFARYGVVAVPLVPSWLAGIHRMRWTRYVPVNAISAVAWAAGVGLAAYYVGPAVSDIVSDIGSAAWAIVALLVVAGAVAMVRHVRRAPRKHASCDSLAATATPPAPPVEHRDNCPRSRSKPP